MQHYRLAIAGLAFLAMASSAFATRAAVVIENAEIRVNFTDFLFRNADGDSLSPADVVTITHSAAFVGAPDIIVGDATASSSGDAQTCDGNPSCGDIISMFPLRVTASATADPVGPSSGSAGGESAGVFNITNITDQDIFLDIFVEADISWEQLQAGVAATDLARIDAEVGYQFDAAAVMLATLSFFGDVSGGDSGSCDFDVCSPRVTIDDLVLPAGETRTLTGYGRLSVLAQVTPDGAVPEPGTPYLAAALLALAGARCAMRGRLVRAASARVNAHKSR